MIWKKTEEKKRTKRDYFHDHFSAMMLQALIANPKPGMSSKHIKVGDLITQEALVLVAIELADALIDKLEAGQQ
jgi:hypothetical protein